MSAQIHWSRSNGLGVSRNKLQGAAAVAKVTLGLLFASALQVPLVWQIRRSTGQDWYSGLGCAILSYIFCEHLEYHNRLKAEAVECKNASFGSLNQKMPFLENETTPWAICLSTRNRRSSRFWYRTLRQSHSIQSALLAQSWPHIRLMVAVIFRMAID